MTDLSSSAPLNEQVASESQAAEVSPSNEPKPSYVKLAMRNMVKKEKRGTSLKHFALTTIGLLTVLVGLAYLTR